MISARLLVAAAFLSSTCLIAQDTPSTKSQVPDNANFASTSQNAALTIDRLGLTWATSQQNPLLKFQGTEPPISRQDPITEIKHLENRERNPFAISSDSFSDYYCLKIRSYLVARDSKNSDSTHLVGYSTCLPASRYRLRTTVGSTQPALSH